MDGWPQRLTGERQGVNPGEVPRWRQSNSGHHRPEKGRASIFFLRSIFAKTLHPPGALLSVANASHLLTALMAVALMAVGVVLTVLGPQRPAAVSRGGGAALLLLYGVGVWLLTR